MHETAEGAPTSPVLASTTVKTGALAHQVPLIADIIITIIGAGQETDSRSDMTSQQLLKDDSSMFLKEKGLSSWGMIVKLGGFWQGADIKPKRTAPVPQGHAGMPFRTK
eukprot:1126837-Pelagomonas_calceolata.AAC.6